VRVMILMKLSQNSICPSASGHCPSGARTSTTDLAEPLDTQAVDRDDLSVSPSTTSKDSLGRTHKRNEDGHEDGAVDVPVPVPDDQTARDDLVRADDEVLPSAPRPSFGSVIRRRPHLAEVDESSSEAESGVDASGRVARETLLGRVPGRHLPEGKHDAEACRQGEATRAGSVSTHSKRPWRCTR
jgi:hypothetical protein